ncbi:MAG TPA: AraC family transcriptional regulator [Burkholderiaceae bacterium]|nr:AraC family transcriptional regulator [Burkholderiaceae bacterium]
MSFGPTTPTAAVPRWRQQFQTSRPDEAVETVERLYGPHSLALRTQRGLDLRLAGFTVGRLTVSGIEYGCGATARTEEPRDYWVFSSAARGEILVGKQLMQAGNAGVRDPWVAGDLPMSADMRLVNLKVTHTDLMDAARTLLGELPTAPLRFAEILPHGSAPAVHLQELVQRLNHLPPCPQPQAALIERRWQEAALLELLVAWPHTWSRHLTPPSPRNGAVERAIDYMHTHANADLMLADVAQAAGVGMRALTRGFERQLGISPMRYLQQCRLERARADLLDARSSVTETAYRWGFGNLGDFAARYRERYGEKPSETLRR